MFLSHVSYQARADVSGTHPLVVYLLHLMEVKRSNLCVSADVHSTTELLRLAEEVGASICVLKTHADIIDDFGQRTIDGLKEVAKRKKFLIFEDRKFGDIGNTVQSQYTRGPLAISSWAHFVNAHIFPGPAVITALKSAADSTVQSLKHLASTELSVGKPGISIDDDDRARKLAQMGDAPHARGLLLLAEMSSEGNLMKGEYTKLCHLAAREHSDFVCGFISQRSLNEPHENFLSFTPGVSLPPEDASTTDRVTGDGMGQQYRTPDMVIRHDGCDIVIVGRGILGAINRGIEAERYREAAWRAYLARTKN